MAATTTIFAQWFKNALITWLRNLIQCPTSNYAIRKIEKLNDLFMNLLYAILVISDMGNG